MNQEQLKRMKSVVEMLSFMTSEIKHNLMVYILNLTNEKDKYAINSCVNPDLTVSFGLLNIENGTIATCSFTYEEFANLCSNVIVMEDSFKAMADMMIDRVQKTSTETLTINNKFTSTGR